MEHLKRIRYAAWGAAALLFAAIVLFPSCRRAREERGALENTAATSTARPASPSSQTAPPSATGMRKAAKPELQIAINGLQEGTVLYAGTRALVEIRLRHARAQAEQTGNGGSSESDRAAQRTAPIVVGTESRPWLDMVRFFVALVEKQAESEAVEIKVRWISPKEIPPGRLELDAVREGTATGILEASEIGRFAAAEYSIFAELRADEGGPSEAGTFVGRVRSHPVAVKFAAASETPSVDDLDLRAYVEAEAARLEGNEGKARDSIAARLAQNPDSIAMRIMNAEILESQGRLSEALEDLRKALDTVKAKAGRPGEIKETPDLLIRRIARLEKRVAGQKK